MGQKVNPVSFRLGYSRNWDAMWYGSKKDFSQKIAEDLKIRKYVLKNYKSAAIARVVIERASEKIRLNIYTARPGVIIGRRGTDIDKLRDHLMKLVGSEVQLNIREIKNPSIEAQLVAENIALQLEKRIAFRRAMKKSIQQAMDAGAKGIKVYTKGRLGGSEIARKEGYHVGSIPLHTIRAEVDYGFAEANTTYGKIGIKVWIFKGEHMQRPNILNLPDKKAGAAALDPGKTSKKKESKPKLEPVAVAEPSSSEVKKDDSVKGEADDATAS